MILTVMGPKPPGLGGYSPNSIHLEVKKELEKYLIANAKSLTNVYTGMELGVGQWIAEICFMNDIPFHAALPFTDHEMKWPPASQAYYKELLKKAASITYVSGPGYAAHKFHDRDRWMLLRSSRLLMVNDTTGTCAAGPIAMANDFKLTVDFINTAVAIQPAEATKKETVLNPAAQLMSDLMGSLTSFKLPDPYEDKSKGWSKLTDEDILKLLLSIPAGGTTIEFTSKPTDVSSPTPSEPTSKGVKQEFGRKLDIDD